MDGVIVDFESALKLHHTRAGFRKMSEETRAAKLKVLFIVLAFMPAVGES